MTRSSRFTLSAVVTTVAVAGLAQEAEYTGLETVRAVEVSVALVGKDGGDLERSAAEQLAVDDLIVRVDGLEVPATSLDLSGSSDRPWQFLIYLDLTLSSPGLVARSAATLGARAKELVELGTVELVVADPMPRRLLAPTRDSSLVDSALSGLALAPSAADELIGLRAQLRGAAGASGDEVAELAAELLRRELETVRRQQDLLLSWLVTRADPAASRALFLVSGGFDLHPEAFYGTYLQPGESTAGPRLGADYAAVARAVAGYGWLTVILQRPEPDPLPRRWGLRRQLLVRLDRNWDPERAESQLELGETLIRQKKWKRAAAALEESVYSFHDQPKLRNRQAFALSRLGYVLEQQDRTAEAHKVYRKAIELDPQLNETIGPGVAGLLDPLAPLAELAEATSGGIVRDERELDRLLEGLGYRSRLTFQLAGPGDSGLHQLEVSARRGDHQLLAPRWVRSATPEAVSAARARRLLDEELEVASDGEQILETNSLSLRCGLESAGGPATLEIKMVPRLPVAWEGVATAYRVSMALPTSSLGSVVRHRSSEGGIWSPGEVWHFDDRFGIDAGRTYLSVVVEEMNTGRWLGSLVECDEAS